MLRPLLVLAVLTLSAPAYGQRKELNPPLVTIPPGPDQIVTLSKGKEAPFSGQLFSNDTAMRWGFWMEQYRFRLDADVQREADKRKIEADYSAKILKIEQDKYKVVTNDLQALLKRSENARRKLEIELHNPPWYRTGTFHFVSGATTMVGVFALSVWAINSTR